MSDYPEHDRQALVVDQTQAIGEFIDWLGTQGVQFMTWREDMTDSRPTDPDCRVRRAANSAIPCKPSSASDTGTADYYSTHCLHWHDPEREAEEDREQGICCWCGKGKYYEVTGLRSWAHESRGTLQLLADWAGIDLAKIEAEKRQMLTAIRAANEAA
jgi:hypothetical protein